MQTIEQLLKTTIETAMNAVTYDIYGRTVYLTNDLRFHDKETVKEDIYGVIRTGQGVRSNIPGFNAVQSRVMLMLEVEANWLQPLLGCLNAYVKNMNGVVSTVTDTRDDEPAEADITYSYRLEWDLPMPNATPYDVLCKAATNDYGILYETTKMIVVTLNGTLTYSADQSLNDRTIYVEGTAFTWDASTQAYWNTAGTVNSAYDVVNNSSTNSAALPTANASNIAGRVNFNGSYGYYRSNGYRELEGVTSYGNQFMPSHNSVQAVNSVSLDLNFESAQIIHGMTFIRNKADAIHNQIAAIPYANISNTSADLKMRFDVTSLNVSSYQAVKITDLKTSEVGGFETITLSVVKE